MDCVRLLGLYDRLVLGRVCKPRLLFFLDLHGFLELGVVFVVKRERKALFCT